MSNCYVLASDLNYLPQPNDNIMDSIFKQYERVIIESIITSFGLDFLVHDRHGGDVDTIYNVRKIGEDSEMLYKNRENQKTYENRGNYDSKNYHSGTNYQTIKHDARSNYRDSGQTVTDEYTGNQLHFLGNSKGANPNINAELDHVIAAKSIHNDKGRILSGLSGTDLANSPENLKFTNKSLNASMQDMEIPDYIEKHPELSPEVKEKMMKHYQKAKKTYESKIAKEYYTSSQFAKDTAIAVGNVGFRMGLRQALGFVFTEVWFSVKDEFASIKDQIDLENLLIGIGNGIKRGFENAQNKFKELFAKFIDGAVAGILSSLSTTLANIFFTTAKNVVRIIRQTYASLVQAAKVLFINPENLPFGERMRAIVKILATGASVAVGVIVSESIEKLAIGSIPVIGEIIPAFCGSLVTGIMSCTLLHFFDRSDIMNRLVRILNNLHTVSTEVNYFYQQAAYFENYAAELMKIDIEKFREETAMYSSITLELEKANNDIEVNAILEKALNKIGVKIPWDGDFRSFMSDKKSVLVFE